MAAAQHADAVLVDCQPNTMHFRLKFLAAVLNLTHTHTHTQGRICIHRQGKFAPMTLQAHFQIDSN